jgi:tetratricopeptide (TPR) repeat protein
VKRFALPAPVRRRAALAGWASLALAVVIAVAVSSGTIANEYQRFVRPGAAGNAQDVRSRLTDPANNGRFGYWSVAWEQFKHAPAVGWGAGSYANAWARHRTNSLSVEDAHSLYLETLEELGVVGLALLLITILTILARVAARARGSGRVLYAAVFAVLLAWAIHAGVDWDWEMPVVTVIFFFLGGFVLGRRVKSGRAGGGSETGMYRGERRPRGYAAPLVRASIAVCLIPLAVLPAYVWLSQGKLDDAAYAFAQGDCVTARQSALSSISILGDRAEPYEIASYCDLRLGMSQAALSAIEKAVSLDPRNWNYRYGLALMRGAAGLDPRGAAWQALSLNPHDLLAQSAWSAFRSGRPARWKAAARSIAAQFNSL